MKDVMSTEDSQKDMTEFVTAMIGGQLFGLPIARVQDVFMPDKLTRVPLASADVAGILNLRGRIVTAINLHYRLGLPKPEKSSPLMAIGIEFKGESYGLLIDTVGEVLKLAPHDRQPNPINLEASLARVSAGVYRLPDHLLVILDVDRLLDRGGAAMAA
jgi:purine-binding chemotaxis protein CheW